MERKGFLETGHIEIAALASIVGGMDTNTQVGTHHEHGHIKAQAQARSQRQFVKEILHLQLTTGTAFIILQQPDVAGIKEDSAVEITQDWETVLDIGLKLECTRLVVIAIRHTVRVMETAGTQCAHSKSPHRVGATHIELFPIRHLVAVAVGMGRSQHHPRG